MHCVIWKSRSGDDEFYKTFNTADELLAFRDALMDNIDVGDVYVGVLYKVAG